MLRLALISFATALSLPAALASNGEWRFEVTTEVGQCEGLRRYPVVVADGRIGPGEGAPANAVGFVENNGNLWARFSTAEDIVRIQGRLSKASGSGTWSSGHTMCGGKWRASRG